MRSAQTGVRHPTDDDVRRTLKTRLTQLEQEVVSPKFEVGWVDARSGETQEGVIKARSRDQIPPNVVPVTALWVPGVQSTDLP